MRWLLLAACCYGIICSGSSVATTYRTTHDGATFWFGSRETVNEGGARPTVVEILPKDVHYLLYKVSTTAEEDGQPTVEVITKATTFNVGDRKAIYCEGKSLTSDLEWYSPSKEKVPKKSTDSKRVYVEQRHNLSTGATLLALLIQRMTLDDTGTYTCRSGDLTDTINIFVGEKVVMKESEEDFMNDEGKFTIMSCQAKGTPTPEIQWYKDNKNIVTNDKYKITYMTKSSTSYLRINDLNHLDSGTYICKATQEKISHFAEKACHLTVQHKPVIMNEFMEKEVYAILDEWKNITCKAIANPQPLFSWSKHNTTYDEEMKGETEEYKITSETTSSVLTLHITNDTLDMQYKCIVENSKGRQNFIFHVSLGNKPDPPTDVKAIAATANNITFDVSCPSCIFYTNNSFAPRPENLTVLGYVFELVPRMEGYDLANWLNATEHRFKIADADDNGTMFTVEGLDKATEYHVRVATINLAGQSEWFTLAEFPKTTDGAAALAKSLGLLIIALTVSLSF